MKKWEMPRIAFLGKWRDKIKERTDRRRETSGNRMRSDEMMSLSVKLKTHLSKARLRTILLIGAGVLLIGIAVIYTQVRVLDGYRVLSSVERTDDETTSYVRLGNRLLKCNPNGVTCVNGSDVVQWNVTFTMQSPMVDTCGPMVAVGDQRGQDVYIFNKDGQVGHFEAEHTLMKVRVASQGVVAAVLEDGETTWVNVYDSQGTVLVKMHTSMSEPGYPLDVDLSSDGQKMAVSFLTMDNNDIISRIAFYNFSSVGQNESDNLVNSVEYPGKVVPQVSFLDNNYAVAVRDDGLTFFGGRQVPEQKAEITLQQEIVSLFQSEDYVGIVTLSDEEEPAHKYKMQVYRANGSKCGTRYFDMDYTDIAISGREILLYGNNEISVFSAGGKKEAELEYEKQILGMVKVGGLHRYEVITPDSTDRIKLR